MIYESLKKDLYGALITSLLLWWDKSGALGSWVFEPNPYDGCVMNKTGNGKQCTICWHMNDLKISSMSLKVVDGVLSHLTVKYGYVSALFISRGHGHEYLGMRIDYGTKGKILMTMPKHIDSIMMESAEHIDGISKKPSANHLLKVREYGEILVGTLADLFWTLVEKYCSSASSQELTSIHHCLSSQQESVILMGMTTRTLPVRYVTSGKREE